MSNFLVARSQMGMRLAFQIVFRGRRSDVIDDNDLGISVAKNWGFGLLGSHQAMGKRKQAQ